MKVNHLNMKCYYGKSKKKDCKSCLKRATAVCKYNVLNKG